MFLFVMAMFHDLDHLQGLEGVSSPSDQVMAPSTPTIMAPLAVTNRSGPHLHIHWSHTTIALPSPSFCNHLFVDVLKPKNEAEYTDYCVVPYNETRLCGPTIEGQ